MADDAAFTDEESLAERAFDYDRTVALSDGVFAIALTLLVLSLTVPILRHGHTDLLGSKLLHREQEFVSYAISFAVISFLWVRHHQFFRGLQRIDGRITALNLAYLAFVAFLPFPTHVLGLYGDQPASAILYAVTVAILSSITAIERVYAQRAGLLSPSGARAMGRREHWAVPPAVFIASIPIAFVSTTAAQLFWLVLLLPRFRSRARALRSSRNHGHT